MSSGLDEYWDRHIRQNNIPPEFGGPVKGVTGKGYEQLEFDFSEPKEPTKAEVKREQDYWKLKNNVNNHILQAKAIIDIVMNDIGSQGFSTDQHEFALWGASELLQNAADLLE